MVQKEQVLALDLSWIHPIFAAGGYLSDILPIWWKDVCSLLRGIIMATTLYPWGCFFLVNARFYHLHLSKCSRLLETGVLCSHKEERRENMSNFLKGNMLSVLATYCHPQPQPKKVTIHLWRTKAIAYVTLTKRQSSIIQVKSNRKQNEKHMVKNGNRVSIKIPLQFA